MSPLYAAPVLVIVVLIVASLLGALEVGHWLGRLAPVEEHQAAIIATPILALVGLLLAFSFGMAGDRHALRRAAAVNESNSIGTFYLRTELLPEPTRSEMRTRLRRYVDVHLEHRDAGIDEDKTHALEAEAERLQQDLWALLMQDAHGAPDVATLLLVTPALNSMIDDAATMLAVRENRIPDAIFLYLFVLVIIAGIVVGYRPRGEKRHLILWAIFTAVLSGVLVVLVDLDRPRRGLIQTEATPYLRLRESMQETR